jgi:hypothetical protein
MADKNGFVPQKLTALWRKHRVRRVGYAVLLIVLAPVWHVTSFHFMVAVEVAIGLAAAAVTTWTWLRAADRPLLDRLIESPSSAVLVDHSERGSGWYQLRVVLGDGDELRFRVTSRELRQYGQMLAGFCRKAEVRLPGLTRSATA